MDRYLNRAEKAPEAEQLCSDHKLYDDCANRSYYAMFWTAIAALSHFGLLQDRWRHGGLIATFGKELVRRQRAYPPEMGRQFNRAYDIRLRADYEQGVTDLYAAQSTLHHAQAFLERTREVIRL